MKKKKSELLVSSFTRNATDDEIIQLTYFLSKAASPKKRTLKAILNTFVFWGASLFALLLVSGVINYFAASSETLTRLLAFNSLQTVVITITGAYATFKSLYWLKNTDNPYPLILEDIHSKQIKDETYHIEAVCRFQEPQLGGYIYFFKISTANIFVVYDYQSQHNSLRELPIKDHIVLSQAMHSGIILEHNIAGQDISLQGSYALNVSPKEWPKDKTWLNVEWTDLEKMYSSAI